MPALEMSIHQLGDLVQIEARLAAIESQCPLGHCFEPALAIPESWPLWIDDENRAYPHLLVALSFFHDAPNLIGRRENLDYGNWRKCGDGFRWKVAVQQRHVGNKKSI